MPKSVAAFGRTWQPLKPARLLDTLVRHPLGSSAVDRARPVPCCVAPAGSARVAVAPGATYPPGRTAVALRRERRQPTSQGADHMDVQQMAAGTVTIGGDLTVNRLGLGTNRIR